MSYDNLNRPDPGASGQESGEPGFVPRPSSQKPGRMADREVPIPTGHTTMVVQQWLDGEADAMLVRATPGGNDAVDLWTKINDEAELLRSRTTPLYVHKRIMEALPDDIYRSRQPWYRRQMVLNPAMVAVGAAALLGLGVFAARLLLH